MPREVYMNHVVHMRRCHLCGHVTAQQNRVERCAVCEKPFAPFYYFDDQFSPIYCDIQERPLYFDGEVRPLQGLTAYWEKD